MYREVEYSDNLLKYWRDEQNSPRWHREALDTDNGSDESFEAFCRKHRMFEIDEVALLYCEYVKWNVVQIHFSLLRKQRVQIQDLIDIRNQLFDENVMWIFGWIAKKNWWLRGVVECVGMSYDGIEDNELMVKGKPFPRLRYSMFLTDFLIVEKPKSLLLSV